MGKFEWGNLNGGIFQSCFLFHSPQSPPEKKIKKIAEFVIYVYNAVLMPSTIGRRTRRRMSRGRFNLGRWLLLFSAAALCSASLSADSASSRGGLLFSEWRGDENGAATGSFVVRSEGGSAFSAAADGISRELRAVAQDVPLRELGLDALFGRQTTDIADWSRNKAEKAGWRLANSWGRDFVFAATEGARLRGLIRSADFGLESDLGGRRANVHIDVLGALRETDGDAVAWQMRAYAGKDAGGNAGLIYRRIVNENARALRDSVFGETLLGLNAFLDYEKHKDGGGFWRWSAGGEFRTAWVDGFGNLYRGITDARHREKDGRKLASYTSDGYDLRVAVHAPEHPWLIASATYFSFDGEFGQKDETGWRGGLTYRPRNLPLEVAVEYEDSELHGAELGGRIAYKHHFGGVRSLSRSSGGDGFDPRDYFFARASREYTQRIRTADLGEATPPSIFGRTLGALTAGLVGPSPRVELSGGGSVLMTTVPSGSVFSFSGADFNNAPLVTLAVQSPNKVTVRYIDDAKIGTIVIGSTAQISLQNPYVLLERGKLSVNAPAGLVAVARTVQVSVMSQARFSLILDTPTAQPKVVLESPDSSGALMIVSGNTLTTLDCSSDSTDPADQFATRCPIAANILVTNATISGTKTNPHRFTSFSFEGALASLSASGGAGDYTYAKTGGSGGLGLDDSNGEITVIAANFGTNATATLGITLVINDGKSSPNAGYAGETDPLTLTFFARLAETPLAVSVLIDNNEITAPTEAAAHALDELDLTGANAVLASAKASGGRGAYTFVKKPGGGGVLALDSSNNIVIPVAMLNPAPTTYGITVMVTDGGGGTQMGVPPGYVPKTEEVVFFVRISPKPLELAAPPVSGTEANPHNFRADYPDPVADLPVATVALNLVSGGAGDYRFTREQGNGLLLNAGDPTNSNYGVISIPSANLIVGQKLGITVKINDGGATPAAGFAGQTPELTYTLFVSVVALSSDIAEPGFTPTSPVRFSGGKVAVSEDDVPTASVLGQLAAAYPTHAPDSTATPYAFTYRKTGGHAGLDLSNTGELSFASTGRPTALGDYEIEYEVSSTHPSLKTTAMTLAVQIVIGALRLKVEHNPNFAGGAPAAFTKTELTPGATPGVSGYEAVFRASRHITMPNPTTLLNKLIPLPGIFRPAGPVYPHGTQPGVASGGRDSGVVAAGTHQDIRITNAIARIYADGGVSITLTHVGAPKTSGERLVLHTNNGLIGVGNVFTHNADRTVKLAVTVQAVATPAGGADPLTATMTVEVDIEQLDFGLHEVGFETGFNPGGDITAFFTGAHAYVVRDGANPATSTLALSGKSRAYIAQITIGKGSGEYRRENNQLSDTRRLLTDENFRVYLPGSMFGNALNVGSMLEDTFAIRDARDFTSGRDTVQTLSVTLRIAEAAAVRPEIRTGLGGQGLSEQNPLELFLDDDSVRLPSQEVATVRLVNQTFLPADNCNNNELSAEARAAGINHCIRFATVGVAAAAAGDTPDFANPFNALTVETNGAVRFMNSASPLEGRSSSDRALHSVVVMLTPTGGSAIPLTLWARVSRPQAVVNVREGRLNLNIPPAGLPEATLSLMTRVDNAVPATPVTLAQNGAIITYPPLGANPFAPTHEMMLGGQPVGDIAVCDRVTDVCSRDLAGLAVSASDDFTVSDGKLRLPQNIGSKLTSGDVKITLKMSVTYAGGKSAESRFTVNFLSADFFGVSVGTFYEEATKLFRDISGATGSVPVINLPANDSADVVVDAGGGTMLTLQTGGNEYLTGALTLAEVSCVGGTGNCTGELVNAPNFLEGEMNNGRFEVKLKATFPTRPNISPTRKDNTPLPADRLHYDEFTAYRFDAVGTNARFSERGFHPATVKMTRGTKTAMTVLHFQIRADAAESVPVVVPGTSYMTFGEYAAATSQNSLTLILANVRIAHSSIADSRGDEQATYVDGYSIAECTETGTDTAPDWCDQIAVAESGAVVFSGSPDNVAVEASIGVATLLVQGKPEERIVFAAGPIGAPSLIIWRQGAGSSSHDVLVGKARKREFVSYSYNSGKGNLYREGGRAFWQVTAFIQAHGKDVTVTHSAQPQLVTIQDGLKIGLGGVLKIGNSVRTEPFGAELKIRVSRKVGYAADGTQSVHLSTATMLVSVVPTPLNPSADNVAEAQARPALPLEVESDLVGDGSRSNPFIFEIGGFQTAMTDAAGTATPQPYNYYQTETRTGTDKTAPVTPGIGQFAERAHREKLIAAVAPAGSGHPYLDPKQWHVDMYQANTRQPGSRASYTDGAFGLALELQNKVSVGAGIPARAEIRFNHVNRPGRDGFEKLTLAVGIGRGGSADRHLFRVIPPGEDTSTSVGGGVALITIFNRIRYSHHGAKFVDGLPNPPRIGMHTIVIAARARHISEYSLFDGEGKLKDRGVVGEVNCRVPFGQNTRTCTLREHAAQSPSGHKAGTRVTGNAVFYSGRQFPQWQNPAFLPLPANEAYIYRAGSRIQMLTLYVNVREAPQAAVQMLNRRSGQLNPAATGMYAMAMVAPEGQDGVVVNHPVPTAPATVNYDQLLGGFPLAEFGLQNIGQGAEGAVEWHVNAPFVMRGGTLYTAPHGLTEEMVIPASQNHPSNVFFKRKPPGPGSAWPEYERRDITISYGGWDEIVAVKSSWVRNKCATPKDGTYALPQIDRDCPYGKDVNPTSNPNFRWGNGFRVAASGVVKRADYARYILNPSIFGGVPARPWSSLYDVVETPSAPRVTLTAHISAPRYGAKREFRVIFAKP